MAHECPECGMRCHCGGDIDDLCLPDGKYQAGCTCCDCKQCGKPKDYCECDHYDWEEDEFVDEYDPATDCPRCQGAGEVPTADYESYLGTQMKPCPQCHGKLDGLGHGPLS